MSESPDDDDRDFTPNLAPINRRIRELKEHRRQNAYLFAKNRSLSTELEILVEIRETDPEPEEIRDAYIDTSLKFLDGISVENAGAHAALDTAVECLTPYDPDDIDVDIGADASADEWTEIDVE